MRISRIILDVDMRQSHDGLRAVAKAADTNLNGKAILFMNTAWTKFKIMVNDKYVVYYSNGGRRIPHDAIVHLPQDFGGTEMEMNDAIRKSLMAKIKWEN